MSFGTPRKIAGTQIAALPLLFAVALFGSLAHLACDSAAPDDDATQGDAAPGDGGGPDAAPGDGGGSDAAPGDGGGPDAAPSDGGGPDAAATDQITPTYAPTYFVSPSGNDGNDGLTAAAAWATIDKVNAASLKPGNIVAFECGGKWEGSVVVGASGSANNPITIGAYGSGLRPKIYGSTVITGWTPHAGNIYKATAGAEVTQLFIDGTRARSARFPNTGYAAISAVNSSTSFTSAGLDAGIDYTGATWTGRTTAYATVSVKVASSTGKTITLPSAPYSSLNVDEGFILTNKLELLDAAGEWYFDPGTSTVYLWLPAGDSPVAHTVRGSVHDNGVSVSDRKYVTIRDLHLLEGSKEGLKLSGTNNTVANNIISDFDSMGIYLTYGSEISVSDNTVSGSNHFGIYAFTKDSAYSGNRVSDTCRFDNLGITGVGKYWFSGSGVYVEGNDNTIEHNRVIDSGYNGIQFAQRNVVQYNFINNACLTKDDGGGIYTSSSAAYPGAATNGSIIRHNIVDGVTGTLAGWSKWNIPYGEGIYLDTSAGGVTVDHNTVANCTANGIYLHDSYNETVTNNTVFNTKSGLLINGDLGGTSISKNLIYALARDIGDSQTARLVSRSGGPITINGNTYVAHYKSADIFRLDVTNYSFAGWKSQTGQDATSSCDLSALGAGESEALFYNTTMSNKTFYLNGAVATRVDGQPVTGSFDLSPFTSVVLTGTGLTKISK